MDVNKSHTEIVVIGVSAGGFEALNYLVTEFQGKLMVPIIVVQHRTADNDSYLVNHLNILSKVSVNEVNDKEPIVSGKLYIAPADYHVLIEQDYSFSLSKDRRINHARPSIDVLFETAAQVYKESCLGIILTGKNGDGAKGLLEVVKAGGKAIVQDPQTAGAPEMPTAAMQAVPNASILKLDQIAKYLGRFNKK